MKKLSLVLITLMALSIVMYASPVKAYPITQNPSTNPKIIEWVSSGAYADYQTLAWNPEYIQVETVGVGVQTTTTLLLEGEDVYGQPIQGQVIIPGGTVHSLFFTFVDPVSTLPVAFAKIDKIIQQGGTDNDKFEFFTSPYPFEQDLGEYTTATQYTFNTLAVVGIGQAPHDTLAPIQPADPDPIKVVINWVDGKNPITHDGADLIPDFSGTWGTPTNGGIGDFPYWGTINGVPFAGAQANTLLTIEGLDQLGRKIIKTVAIHTGDLFDLIPSDSQTWSSVCKVTGGAQGDQYWIFTEPAAMRALFYYYILIDHITIQPQSYDILANPATVPDTGTAPTTPGQTTVTVAFVDVDGNLVNTADYGTYPPPAGQIHRNVIVNLYTSGGTITPSEQIVVAGNSITTATLMADTNPRTINVTADANIPPCAQGYHDEMNLWAWTEMTFDGINSANLYQFGDWPVHTLMWGYGIYTPGTTTYTTLVSMPVPPKPVLPTNLGGPAANGIKLDGPIYEISIPLFVGCNLISSPVHPLLANYYNTGYPATLPAAGALPSITTGNTGIPMDLLFGATESQNIEAIWWYAADGVAVAPAVGGTWNVYVPGVSAPSTATFTDGVGYWIKAEKPATLELSGVVMENGPFTPPTYQLRGNTWSLIGFTSVNAMATTDYLESTMGSTCFEAAGPVWQYTNPGLDAQGNSVYPSWLSTGWTRDPAMLYPGQAFWVYNKVPTSQYIAP